MTTAMAEQMLDFYRSINDRDGVSDALAMLDAIERVSTDECDAPSDWDAGTVCFDPYV